MACGCVARNFWNCSARSDTVGLENDVLSTDGGTTAATFDVGGLKFHWLN